MRLFDRRTPEAKFWDWFVKNQGRIAEIRTGTEKIVPELAAKLSAVHDGLMWEKGQLPDGTQDFIVSADGIVERWAGVRRLVDAAPVIPGWQITAFRPRHTMEAIEFRGQRMTLRDLAFIVEKSPERGALNLTFLIEGLAGGNRETMIGAAFILLDSLVGEEAVMTRFGTLEFVPMAEGNGTERPVGELPALLDLHPS